MEYSIELYNDENSEIKLTVALPVYNSKNIAWIAIESLCEQINIDFNWELIVYEENHTQSVFPHILQDYEDLLIKVGCKRIVFITNNEKVSLVEKWIEIGKNVSDSSKCFLLQAADCYSPKTRLKISYEKIVNEDYDWYDQTKGYFYSFISDRVILYDYKGLTNLNMSLKTEYIKTLPFSPLKKGIDGYIYNHSIISCKQASRNFRRYFDDELYNDSIDTHGHNNISHARESYFDTKPNIFSKTNLSVDDLAWNNNIKNSIDLTSIYELTIIISTYLNTQYLEECFGSIINSIGEKKVQVLVGIDSCLESKEHIESHSYPSYFEFFFFEKNNGPYIVFNTLSKLALSKNLLFFGSDDIMNLNMIEDSINGLMTHDCVKPYYTNFNDGKPFDSQTKKHVGEGVFAIKKDIFEYMNGFEPWMCAADSDFMGRLYGTKQYKFKFTNKINFYRRIHKNGLTSRPDTGMGSKLRAHYGTLARQRNSIGPIQNMVVEPYVIVHRQKTTTPIQNMVVEPYVIVHRQKTTTPRKEITSPNIPRVEKNVSPLSLLQNKNSEPQPIRNYVKQEVKHTPKSQIKERPPISQVKQDYEPEKPIDKNSLSNKAKGVSVNSKQKTPKSKDFNIGKDSLRI